MSEQTPQGDFSPGFDDPATRGGLDGRGLRVLLAGAAGIAVLGAFTGGYLWVSSSPSLDTAGAVTPGAPTDSTPAGTSTTSASGFAFGGSDLFDDSFLPKDPVFVGAGTSGSGGSGGGSTVPTGSTSNVPVVVSTPTRTNVGQGAGIGATPTPTRPAPVTTTTPTPTKSALPNWEISGYYYEGKNEDGIRGDFITQSSDGHGGYETTLPVGTVLYPGDLLFSEIVKDTAHIENKRGLDAGWYVAGESALPSAAMGGADKQLRMTGVRNSQVFFFQIDRGPSVQVAIGDKIPGTDFVVEGPEVDGITEDGDNYFYVSDAAGVIWYGTNGGGEDAGLLF